MNRFPGAAARRGFGAICLVAGVVALSAACSSASTPGPAPSAVGGSGAASATATASAGAGGGASASDTAQAGGSGGATSAAGGQQAGTNTCLVRYLHSDVGQVGAAAGSEYVTITFKNLNNQPCTLFGYPGVSAGNGTPVTQVGQPASRNNAVSSTVVTLAPGGYAFTTLQIANALNYPTANCKPAAASWLLVYPPNTSNLLYVPYNTKVCTTSIVNMSVQAVRPGKGGA